MLSNADILTKFESYLLTEKRVAHNTFDAYKRDLKQFESFLSKAIVSLPDLTLEHLKEFLSDLKNRGMSARSMARKISCLKTLFSYLHDYFNYTNHAEHLFTPRLEKKIPTHLTATDVEKLLKEASLDTSAAGVRNFVMLSLLYVSGMRISELIHIKMSSLDFEKQCIIIQGKGAKERMVPLPHETIELLEMYIEGAYKELLIKNKVELMTDYLFPSYYGKELKALSRQSFWLYLREVALKAGIKKDFSPHSLRHSLATHLLKNGANLRSLQLLLGHEQLDTVQIYTHLETTHLRKLYDIKHPRS